MSLGEGVSIERNCWIQVVNTREDEDSTKLIIKSNAGIGMGSSISAAAEVVIGQHTLLGRNVYISDHAHAFGDITIPIMRQGIDNIKPVSIGQHTWLGQNAVVLPGASIGMHCVIGANAVVNSHIPDFSVAVGAPARVVKRYSPETRRWEKLDYPS
jgi:acetyltransferase-like isoleucine patch superfamily enzyme